MFSSGNEIVLTQTCGFPADPTSTTSIAVTVLGFNNGQVRAMCVAVYFAAECRGGVPWRYAVAVCCGGVLWRCAGTVCWDWVL